MPWPCRSGATMSRPSSTTLPERRRRTAPTSRLPSRMPSAVTAGTRYRVQLGFRIDLSQLPRPLHIGVLGRSGWDLALLRSQWLVAEPSP